jgi:hypothetical protein
MLQKLSKLVKNLISHYALTLTARKRYENLTEKYKDWVPCLQLRLESMEERADPSEKFVCSKVIYVKELLPNIFKPGT